MAKQKKQQKEKLGDFGYEVILDLYGCDDSIKSKKKLNEYVDQLCELIDMKKYGKCQTPYFGLESEVTKGHSLLQFIETSSITGHFSEYYNTAYLNVFSCKPYDWKAARDFTKKFFGAKKIKAKYLVRSL